MQLALQTQIQSHSQCWVGGRNLKDKDILKPGHFHQSLRKKLSFCSCLIIRNQGCFFSFSAGSRCCSTHNREIQRPPCGHWRGNNTASPMWLKWITVCCPSFILHLTSFFFASVVLGWFGFYTQICQRWDWQREPKAGPHSSGTDSQGTGSPSVSCNLAVQLVKFGFMLHKLAYIHWNYVRCVGDRAKAI